MAKKVVIGMSGGVDSSVSAYLLKQQGYDVLGLFMKNWEDDDDSEYCSSRQDLLDAVSVCDLIDIDLEVVNFSAEYKDRVFQNFLSEYSQGRTPNPDILCNSEIKFRAFLDHALKLGADFIATGHYVRKHQISHADGRHEYQLLSAIDASKDQSYFLYRLQPQQLEPSLFPLGEIHKTQVRQLAQQLGLSVAQKKDSTGICFIGERPFREFLKRYLPSKPGPIHNLEDGSLLGEHEGLMYHTIGQRKGLNIGGIHNYQKANGLHQAWYVAAKDVVRNILWVVQGHDHPALLKYQIEISDMSWISGHAPEDLSQVFHAKARYRSQAMPCHLEAQSECNQLKVSFIEPQWAATPGQSVVIYQNDVCLGGGIINQSLLPEPK